MPKRPNTIVSLILIVGVSVSSSLAMAGEGAGASSQSGAGAGAVAKDQETHLEKARVELGHAFEEYRNGDIDSARRYLDQATGWLRKAAESSNTEKAREEALRLAGEIDELNRQLSSETEGKESELSRYWHQATAAIKREAEHLIHGYQELSHLGRTMGYLLDAKMHFYAAEHDLVSSHDVENATEELDKTLHYMAKASQEARPPIKKKINSLGEDIKILKERTNNTDIAWREGNLIPNLDKAAKSLEEIEGDVSPLLQLRIEQIKMDIRALRADAARNDIQDQYDTIMKNLKTLINEL